LTLIGLTALGDNLGGSDLPCPIYGIEEETRYVISERADKNVTLEASQFDRTREFAIVRLNRSSEPYLIDGTIPATYGRFVAGTESQLSSVEVLVHVADEMVILLDANFANELAVGDLEVREEIAQSALDPARLGVTVKVRDVGFESACASENFGEEFSTPMVGV
jgi:hypothetical protein